METIRETLRRTVRGMVAYAAPQIALLVVKEAKRRLRKQTGREEAAFDVLTELFDRLKKRGVDSPAQLKDVLFIALGIDPEDPIYEKLFEVITEIELFRAPPSPSPSASSEEQRA